MKKHILFSFLFLACTSFTFGAIRYVTPSGAGTMDGTSWANAYPGNALQAAIDGSGLNDEVWVAAGVYYTTPSTDRAVSFHMRSQLAIYGSFAGTETQLSDRDLSNGLTTILSGEIGAAGISDNSYKVIHNQDLDSTAILDGFILEGANDDRSPTNSGNGLGGGMYNDGYTAGGYCHPTVRNCVFRDNIASWGAGAFNNGFSGGNAQPTYLNCVFTQNHALIEAGGMDSYAVGGTASPTVINCVFYENTSATNVGAMYAWGGSGGNCQPVLINCVFANNSATNGYGGAFIADNQNQSGGGSSGTCIVTLQNCILWNNSATGEGQQFYIRGTGAQVVATYSDIDLSGQNAPHIISGGGAGNIDLDPQFGNIASGAGLDGIWMTADDGLQLLNTSPCIDAGDNNGVAQTDLLSNNRIINSTVDMGSYEYVLPTGGVDENSLNVDVEVFPNPTRNSLTVSFNGEGLSDLKLLVTDVSGNHIVNELSIENNGNTVEYQLDVSEFQPGIYFITVSSNHGKITKRFIRIE